MLGFLQRELEPRREGESHLSFGEADQRQPSWGNTYRGTKGVIFQTVQGGPGVTGRLEALLDAMWPVLWTVVRTYAPYVTFPVAFVVGAVGYHLEWFIRGKEPQPVEEEKSISERREDRKLDELLGKDHTQVVSLKDKLEFAPKAVLNRNRPEKN
uniref:Small integral membrane protein 12 n=1 Tax=Bos indicus x Bos taurus TaxID=30522 RepID=A0A4W2EWW5_BOBOX